MRPGFQTRFRQRHMPVARQHGDRDVAGTERATAFAFGTCAWAAAATSHAATAIPTTSALRVMRR